MVPVKRGGGGIADSWTTVVSGQVADIGTDRRRAPGVAEGAVTVPWVERRVWGH